MERLSLEKIHKTTLDSLSITYFDKDKLFIIGKWYYNFLNSERQELKLTLPFYNKMFTENVFNYLKVFNVIYNLSITAELTEFANTYLFNIFGQIKDLNLNLFSLPYYGQKNGILKWGENTLTRKNQFLPIFDNDQILDRSLAFSIINSFTIFKAIRKNNIINYPIKINLEKLTLFLKCKDDFKTESIISYLCIDYNKNNTQIEKKDIAVSLKDYDFNNQIIIKYPYHYNILNKWFVQNQIKTFNLNFNSRFIYDIDNIDGNDIIILPRELNTLSTNEQIITNEHNYLIFETNHTENIYLLIKEIRKKWKEFGFNIYTHPFPKYFFFFINQSLNPNEWIDVFEKSYPAVSQTTLMNEISDLIIEIYNLNWIHSFLETYNSKINFVFPELFGNKSKRLKKAFNSFENYTRLVNKDVTFTTKVGFNKNIENYILNGFDQISSVNNLQTLKNTYYRFLLPDFLFYSFNPFIPLHVLQYQRKVLNTDSRYFFNPSLKNNELELEKIEFELKNELIKKLEKYKSRFKHNISTDLLAESKYEHDEEADISEDEENALVIESDLVDKDFLVKCVFTDNTEYNFLSSQNIFLQRSNFIKVLASQIKKGDLILEKSILNEIISKDDFFNRLTEIPDSVKQFRYELGKIKGIFNILKKRGLNIETEYYFMKGYVSTQLDFISQDFKLPRKKDWMIICDFLGIDRSDMNMAYVARYGLRRKNRIKALYQSFINTFIENNFISETQNPSVISEFNLILSDFQDIFPKSSDFEPEELIKSMIDNIINEIDKLVKEIKEVIFIYNE